MQPSCEEAQRAAYPTSQSEFHGTSCLQKENKNKKQWKEESNLPLLSPLDVSRHTTISPISIALGLYGAIRYTLPCHGLISPGHKWLLGLARASEATEAEGENGQESTDGQPAGCCDVCCFPLPCLFGVWGGRAVAGAGGSRRCDRV